MLSSSSSRLVPCGLTTSNFKRLYLGLSGSKMLVEYNILLGMLLGLLLGLINALSILYRGGEHLSCLASSLVKCYECTTLRGVKRLRSGQFGLGKASTMT